MPSRGRSTSARAMGFACCIAVMFAPASTRCNLFLGTKADNIADMRAKGRARDLRGEAHPAAVLDAAAVSIIRQLLSCGVQGAFIAKCFGVGKQNIYEIKRGRTWRHLSQ